VTHCVALLIFLCTGTARLHADVVFQSNLTIDLNYNSGNSSYSFTGTSGGVSLVTPAITISALPGNDEWTNPLAWSASLTFDNTLNATNQIYNTVAGITTDNSATVLTSGITTAALLGSQGPTQENLSFNLPVAEGVPAIDSALAAGSASVAVTDGSPLTWAVNIPSGTNMDVTQSNIMLQSAIVQNGGSLTLRSGSSISTTSALTNNGSINWFGGSIGNLNNSSMAGVVISGSGQQTILANSTVNNSGGITQLGPTLTINGYTGSNFAPSVLNNLPGSTYNILGDGGIAWSNQQAQTASNYSPAATINNSGVFAKIAGTGTSVVGSGIAFNNSDLIEVNSGTLQFNGGGSLNVGSGFMFASNGTAQLNGGTFALQGYVTTNGTGTLQISGANVAAPAGVSAMIKNLNSGSNLVISGGSLSAAPGQTVTVGYTGNNNVQLSGGSVNNIINTGSFLWTGGNVGNFTNNSLASLTISGANSQTVLSNSTLNNAGDVTQTGANLVLDGYDTLGIDATVINNQLGAIYNVVGNGGILWSNQEAQSQGSYNPDATINNIGVFEKTAGTGVSSIGAGVAFNNSGLVEVNSGTVQFNGGGQLNSGSGFLFASNGIAQLNSGSFAMQGPVTTNGTGTLQISGANVTAGPWAMLSNLKGGSNLVISAGSLNGSAAGPTTLGFVWGNSVQLAGGSVNNVINIGNFVWTGGSVGNFTNNSLANLTISGSGGQTVLSNSTLNNAGTITQSGANLLVDGFDALGVAPTILNNQLGGIYNVIGDGSITWSNQEAQSQGTYNPDATINNTGVFEKSAGIGTTAVGSGIAFNNNGLVEVNSGTVQLNGGGQLNSGSGFMFGNGGVAQLNGGTFTIQGDVTTNGTGTLLISGDNVTTPSGNQAMLSNLSGGSNLVISGGSLSGAAGQPITVDYVWGNSVQLNGGSVNNVINNGNFLWTGGSLGSFTNNSLAGVIISGTSPLSLLANSVTNNGGTITQTGPTVNINGYGGLTFAPSMLNNLGSGIYNIQGDGSVLWSNQQAQQSLTYYPNSTINNAGLFEKTAGLGTSVVGSGITFNNNGLVEVASGTLQFNGGGQLNSGSGFILSNGATAQLNGGAFSLNGWIVAQGNGILQISGGTFTTPTGASAAIANLNQSDGLTLEITGGTISAATGQNITLDFQGASTVQMTGGSLSNVVNSGNFQWSGGSIGNLTNTETADFTVAGSGSGMAIVATSNVAKASAFTGVQSNLLVGSGSSAFTTAGDLNNDGQIEITPGNNLIVSGNLNGAGSLQLDAGSNVYLGGGGNSTQGAISIASGAQLDIGSGTLAIAFGKDADPATTIQSYLATGYDSGAWDGSGIVSSALALNYGLAEIDSGSQILIEPALMGDADLSGTVDATDLQTLLENFGQPGGWQQGNFDYDPTVDLSDLELLLANLPADTDLTAAEYAAIENLAGQFGDVTVPSGIGSSLVAIPEPASVSLLIGGALCLLSRRRNS
jgi:hypothetical protein